MTRRSSMRCGATRRFLRRAGALLLSMPAWGCACGVPPPANPIENGAQMERRMADVAERVRTLRAEARVEQVTERGPMRGTVFVFLGLPDRVRFDSMSPVDTPLAVLVSDGRRFALHDIGANRYYFGPADPCNIARILRIPLPAESVVRVLIGQPPRLDGAEAEVSWDGGGFYVYTQRLPDGRVQTSRLAPVGEHLDTLRVEMRDGSGERLYWAEFADWRPAGDVRLPGRVRFETRESAGPVEVWYVDAEVGVDLPEDAWSYPPPPGIPVEPVGCDTPIEPSGWEPEE